jgi:hypothetical protein
MSLRDHRRNHGNVKIRCTSHCFFTYPCHLQVMNLAFRNWSVTTVMHVLGSRMDEAVCLPIYPVCRGQLTEVVLCLGSGRQLDLILKNDVSEYDGKDIRSTRMFQHVQTFSQTAQSRCVSNLSRPSRSVACL